MRSDLQAVLDALAADQINVAVLGEFEFLSGTVNLWAGPEGHTLLWDSKTWTSIADIGQINKISEAQGLADARTVVSLRINSDNIDVVDVEDSRGRTATITLLLLDDEGAPIGPLNFRTTMGKTSIEASVQIDEDGRKVVSERLALELLNETAQLNRSHFVRMTYEAGLRIDSTDHGLEFVSDPDIGNIGLHYQEPGTPGGRPLRPGERIP